MVFEVSWLGWCAAVAAEYVDDGSLTQTYNNTPWSSLNVSVAGEENDETWYNKDQTSIGVLEDQQQNNGWDKRYMTIKEEMAINESNRGAMGNRQGDLKSVKQDHTLEVQFNMHYESVHSLLEHTTRKEIREECRGVDVKQQKSSHLGTEGNIRLIEEDPQRRLEFRGHHHCHRYLPKHDGQEHELACLDQGARDEQVIGVEAYRGKTGREMITPPVHEIHKRWTLPALPRKMRWMPPA
jgi:hypothetical protein